ncbi:hypothetical protein [Paenibacillus sp. FSL H7-0714]|uniref:hypothetical protein n=1 Tax=Paenibacillus sp. FSL H7-0714 TaxID=2954735 RepID=UPI0030FCEA82
MAKKKQTNRLRHSDRQFGRLGTNESPDHSLGRYLTDQATSVEGEDKLQAMFTCQHPLYGL